jgi:NADH-quinone oxidoreductase subunit M
MMPTVSAQTAPWEVLAVCMLLLLAPSFTAGRRTPPWQLACLAVALVVALFSSTPTMAYGAVAFAAVLHAAAAAPTSRTGAATLTASAVLAVGIAVAVNAEALTTAFLLSCLAIAVRSGALPFHFGVASLCDRAPVVHVQQFASTMALVFVHLRFVDHHAAAIELAPHIIRYGAAAAVMAALMAVVQRDLHGLYRGTVSMHAGMLLAALGAASLDNFAAALLVAVAMGLALGGLGLIIVSLEERVGPVAFSQAGGRIRSFPRMAIAFAFFGGAGVGLPGTAGFIADDLLLHTLWFQSPGSAVVIVVSSALLAVATLMAYSATFLGRPTTSLAPDLSRSERMVALALVVVLLGLGIVPGALIGPADKFLTPAPVVAMSATEP